MDRRIVAMAAASAAAISIVAISQPSYAATSSNAEHRASSAHAAPTRGQDMRMSELLGMEVQNQRGEQIGDIADLIVDSQDGRVRYAVVDAGGFLGIGNHKTAVPISQLRASMDKDHIVVSMTEEQLKRYPSYPPDRRPDWNDASWRSSLDGVAPAPKGAPTNHHRFRRASELLDASLHDRNGNEVGEVKDLVVNLQSGQVRYGVAQMDGTWGDANRLVVIHPRDVRADEDGNFVVVASRDALRDAPSFAEDRWPNINSKSFRERVDRPINQASR